MGRHVQQRAQFPASPAGLGVLDKAGDCASEASVAREDRFDVDEAEVVEAPGIRVGVGAAIVVVPARVGNGAHVARGAAPSRAT